MIGIVLGVNLVTSLVKETLTEPSARLRYVALRKENLKLVLIVLIFRVKL